MNTLDSLISSLSRLPGIGKKSASRLAYHLLKTPRRYNEELAGLILDVKDKIFQCSVCGNYTEEDPCPICADTGRDRSILCIVEQPSDVMTLEATHEYNGLYHVLQGVLSPLDGVGPEDLTFDKLMVRLERDPVREIIMATNPTMEGEATATYLVRQLSGRNIRITKLASGLPVGGDLEYVDPLTLARSLKGRSDF